MACLVKAERTVCHRIRTQGNSSSRIVIQAELAKMSFCKPTAAAAARKQIGMRVLLVEDDSAIARSVELILQSESFNVYTTEFGKQGVDFGKHYFYDIILLDLSLPDMSGFEVLRSLRASKIKTPILILSGIASIENKVKGLGFGADDYMTKPFHKSELLARIHAIVRRSQNHSQSVVQTGDLIVNLDAKTVEVQGARVHLTVKEYQMLELLSLRKGSTLTKEMFLNQLYGGMDEPGIKIIDIFLCKIRKKLARASNGKNYIETVWGRGYLLRDPHEISASSALMV
jgi:two-component system, cell cycle response regulator CtrA